MALDRSFRLRAVEHSSALNISLEETRQLAAQLANKHVLLGNGRCLSDSNIQSPLIGPLLGRLGGEQAALFIPPMNREALTFALMELWTACGNLYNVLQRLGIYVINPGYVVGNKVQLSGGSYSRVLLHVTNNEASVYKLIKKPPVKTNIDAELRLLHEASWLLALPAYAQPLFPRLLGVVDDGDSFGYEAEFIPRSSAAELVFQNNLDSDALASTLQAVYMALCTRLYSNPPPAMLESVEQSTYLDRIERRMKVILNSEYPTNGLFRRLCDAPLVRVNGLSCLPFWTLLDHLRSSPEWQCVLIPRERQLCHGDLILEDILLPSYSHHGGHIHTPMLVDPNPTNQSVLFDVAKTLLSLWIGYEFVYFDLFSFAGPLIHRSGEVEIAVVFDRPECQRIYAEAAEMFLEFVESHLTPFLGLDAQTLRTQLRMTAAIHSLAIPMFHLLHHKSESRAVAFMCLGLYHATLALNELKSLL
jgi:hypothetical protein